MTCDTRQVTHDFLLFSLFLALIFLMFMVLVLLLDTLRDSGSPVYEIFTTL